MRFIKLIIASASLMAASLSSAHSEDVEFTSNVSATCSVVVTRDGTLVASNNVRRLTSQNTAAQRGLATITTTTSIFQASVTPPTAFNTAPAADITPTNFEARIRVYDPTLQPWTTDPVALDSGITRVRVGLIARKTGGNIFPNGTYTATVDLTCE